GAPITIAQTASERNDVRARRRDGDFPPLRRSSGENAPRAAASSRGRLYRRCPSCVRSSQTPAKRPLRRNRRDGHSLQESPRGRFTRAVISFRMTEADRADAGRDVQAAVAGHAERLQREGLIEAADERVRAQAYADRCASGGADIVAVKRAGADVGTRRDDFPDQDATLGITDIDTELGDRADIMLRMPVILAETAVQILGRPEHESPAACDVAGQRADIDAMGSGPGRRYSCNTQRDNRCGKQHALSIQHDFFLEICPREVPKGNSAG